MTRFRYQALNASGDLVTGELQADNVLRAVEQLEVDGHVVQSIANASSAPPLPVAPVAAKPVVRARDGAEQELLRQHMAVALANGKVIIPALRAYADELPRGRRQRELFAVTRLLERGDVAESMAAVKTLPEYWLPLLSAATATGDPGRILRDYIVHSKRADELRLRRWQTLAYPLVVGALAVLLLIVLSFAVVPTFEAIFVDFGLTLPVATMIVFRVAKWIRTGRALVTIAIVGAIGLVCFLAWRSRPLAWRDRLDGRAFNPFGRSWKKAQLAGFSAELLEAGFDGPNALQIAALAIRNPQWRSAAGRLSLQHRTPDIVAPFERDQLPATIEHAVQADIAPAARARLLREVSECYADRGATALSWSRGLSGPLGLLLVGGLVGFLVISLYVPLVSLIQNLSGGGR